jgi:hypothetical protein
MLKSQSQVHAQLLCCNALYEYGQRSNLPRIWNSVH